jgi:type III pantothenate kinase
VDYSSPETIGPDRLANAIAAKARYGAPVLVLDFGTAVTLDVVNRVGDYMGGVIAPGLSAMTDYLHEKTALLPKIHIRNVDRAIGRTTEEAMLIGAVRGYRGLIRELIVDVQKELGVKNLPAVATGGYAVLLAQGIAHITAVDPLLTLDGLRRFWSASPEGRPGTLRHDV